MARPMGFVVGAQSVSWMIGIPLIGILTDAVSWRLAYAVPGVICLASLGAALISPVERDVAVERPADEREGLSAVLRDGSARRWTLAELVAYSAWTAELTYIGAFYIQTYDVSESTVGFLLAIGSVAFAISTLATASLSERFARRRLIVCSALGMGGMIAVIMNVTPAVLFTVCLFFPMALMAGVRSTASSSLGLDQLRAQPGSMMAARTASAQLGYMFGAVIGGAVLAVADFGELGFVLLAGMATSAALVARVNDPTARSSEPRQRSPLSRVAMPTILSVPAGLAIRFSYRTSPRRLRGDSPRARFPFQLEHDMPADAVLVLVDLELDLEPAVVRLGLEFQSLPPEQSERSTRPSPSFGGRRGQGERACSMETGQPC